MKKKDIKQTCELTTDGDTNQYGLIIWLGTKSKARAIKKSKPIVRLLGR